MSTLTVLLLVFAQVSVSYSWWWHATGPQVQMIEARSGPLRLEYGTGRYRDAGVLSQPMSLWSADYVWPSGYYLGWSSISVDHSTLTGPRLGLVRSLLLARHLRLETDVFLAPFNSLHGRVSPVGLGLAFGLRYDPLPGMQVRFGRRERQHFFSARPGDDWNFPGWSLGVRMTW